MSRSSLRWSAAGLLVAMVLAACDSSTKENNNGGGGGGGTNTLTVSSATPASGNGSVTGLQVVVDENSAVAQGPAVYVAIAGAVGGTLHSLEVYILKADNSLPNIEHKWGANLLTPDGFTLCDAGGVVGTPCSGTQVTASIAQRTITFTGLALTAATGDGDLSTIDGTIEY